MQQGKDYFAFDRSEEAFGMARKKVRYGHRAWLVWKANGQWLVSTKTAESLESAISASRGNKFFAYDSGGNLTAVHQALAQIMLNNARFDSGQIVFQD